MQYLLGNDELLALKDSILFRKWLPEVIRKHQSFGGDIICKADWVIFLYLLDVRSASRRYISIQKQTFQLVAFLNTTFT